MQTLGGVQFVRNAIEFDYCFEESIACLKELCDEIVIIDAGSNDGTAELAKKQEDKKTKVVCLPESEWDKMHGKELIAHFQNMGKEMLSTDWYFLLQSDEILHQDSFPYVRKAIEEDNEGYFCHRINLWGSSQFQLNVTADRLPVGNKIIRLSKTKYYSVDDGEGIYCPATWEYFEKIRIYHVGFVRDKYIHTKKIEHMLTRVFGMGTDKKVEEMNGVFDPYQNFSKEDLIPVTEPLPIFIQEWAKKRDEINQIEI